MAILTKEEFMANISKIVGDSDDDITLLEDMTDTYNDMESRANGIGETAWENKYNELDEKWKKRYKDRFFKGSSDVDNDFINEEQEEEKDKNKKPKTFSDLFTEREV